MIKLHVGSGTVYLKGWINVDLPSLRVFLAADRPDLVDRYATVESAYYARHEDFNKIDGFRRGPKFDEYLCDRYGSWSLLPCPDGQADTLLARQSFEHLSQTEAHAALEESRRVLKQGGTLTLSVPDHEGTLTAFQRSSDPVLIRHLLGPRVNSHGFHMMSYTHDGLVALAEKHGFVFVRDEPNIHAYPAICCSWRRV